MRIFQWNFWSLLHLATLKNVCTYRFSVFSFLKSSKIFLNSILWTQNTKLFFFCAKQYLYIISWKISKNIFTTQSFGHVILHEDILTINIVLHSAFSHNLNFVFVIITKIWCCNVKWQNRCFFTCRICFCFIKKFLDKSI